MNIRRSLFVTALALGSVGYSQVSLVVLGQTYTQNFDSLSTSGMTNALLPSGWYLTETGGSDRDNEQYAANTGSSNTGDTYSYGADSATERAFGMLRTGTLISTIGAAFTNSTGATITSLSIAYTGEQWRLGTASRTDRIDFQYSLNAEDLVTGTWTDVDALDFTTPNTVGVGAKDGNNSGNQTSLSASISGLSIAANSTFFIRWTDFDASGADDGLAVDNFSLTTAGTAIPEPAIHAATIGLVAFCFVVWRRHRFQSAARAARPVWSRIELPAR